MVDLTLDVPPHPEDLFAPGALEALFAHHRALYGDSTMEDGDGDDGDDGGDDDGDDDGDDTGSGDDDGDDDDKELGPKGQRALAAEKEKRRKAQSELRRYRGLGLSFDELRDLVEDRDDDRDGDRDRGRSRDRDRDRGGRDRSRDRDRDRGRSRDRDRDEDRDRDRDRRDERRREREVERDAEARANRRVVRAEVKAAAAGRLADPEDAVAFLTDDQLADVVDEDGEVDADELRELLDDLLERKPHLAAKRQRAGDADGGRRGTKRTETTKGMGTLRAAYDDSSKTRRRSRSRS
jgi:hypothetical protein